MEFYCFAVPRISGEIISQLFELVKKPTDPYELVIRCVEIEFFRLQFLSARRKCLRLRGIRVYLSKILPARKKCVVITRYLWRSETLGVSLSWIRYETLIVSRRRADEHTIMAVYLGLEFQSTLKQIHLDVRACRYRRYTRAMARPRLNCPARYETIGIFPSRSITRKSVSECVDDVWRRSIHQYKRAVENSAR